MSSAWIEFALRGAGLLTAALLLCLLLRRATPALRHALLAATAIGLLVLPAFSALLPLWQAPLLPALETVSVPPSEAATGSAAPPWEWPGGLVAGSSNA